MNSFFDWLKDAGTQAIELFITACAAILALLLTWRYGRNSLTKKDLEPLEQSTAATAAHALKVANRAESMELASRVSLIVSGRSYQDEGLKFTLQILNTVATLTRADLYTESGTSYGSVALYQEPDATQNFTADVPSEMAMRWYKASLPSLPMSQYTQLRLRVYILFDGNSEEGYKDTPVRMTSVQVADRRTEPEHPYGKVTASAWEIHGEV
ncbi:MAG TPA: hypothetical protein VG844_10735 [Terracidiphilus sp.]|nr:hypothetical protein [Terracidiphilus sp.]